MKSNEPAGSLGQTIRNPFGNEYAMYRLKVGYVSEKYPGKNMVDVVLDGEPTKMFRLVPFLLSIIPAATMLKIGDRVVTGFIDGNMNNPIVIGRLDGVTYQDSLATAAPYFSGDPAELDNRVLAIWPHEFASKPDGSEYVKRASWLMASPDGRIRLVHNQQYPASSDEKSPSEFTRKYLVLEISKDDAVKLQFPAGSTARELCMQADDSGNIEISDNQCSVSFRADQTLSLTAGNITLQIGNGTVHIQAPMVTVNSNDIRLAGGSREVAFKGAKIKSHQHSVVVDGHRYYTSTDDSEVEEGAFEVKV